MDPAIISKNKLQEKERSASGNGREYLHDVNRAKGLGIFLVVLGHIVTGQPPADNEWYMLLRAAIYAFHMPFFLYVSGFLFYRTAPYDSDTAVQVPFVFRRAERLLIPFIVFGLIIVIGKHAAAAFLHVDNVSESLPVDLLNMFWDTRDSAAKSIWYVFVLFEIIVILLLAHRLTKSPLALLPLALLFSLTTGATPILYLDRLALFLPFFLMGGIAANLGSRWLSFIDRYLWPAIIAFVAALILTRLVSNVYVSILVCGTLSIPVLHGLCRRPLAEAGGILAVLGNYSFIVYLLNTVAIGLAKAILLLAGVPWNGSGFLVYLPVLLAAGIFGPMLAKIVIFRRVPYLDKLTT